MSAWRDRLARGQCRECPRPAAKGHISCEEHLEQQRVRDHERMQKRRDEGRCLQCGKRLAAEGHTHCAQCLGWGRRCNRERRKDGRCLDCPRPASAGHARCLPCTLIDNAHRAARRFQDQGFTALMYLQMYVAQHYACAICHGPPRGRRQVLDLDHDHKTGAVRKLLCRPCNVRVERLELGASVSPAPLRTRVLRYLAKYRRRLRAA